MKFYLSLFLLFSVTSFGQKWMFFKAPSEDSTQKQLYLTWGYNVSAYTASDIQFTGTDYDITFKKVTATNRPTPFDSKIYFNLSQFTIPQYNLRLGYQWKNKWSLSFNADHMKYVMQSNQYRQLYGDINIQGYTQNGAYNGEELRVYNYVYIEHTDGLNYLNLELTRYLPIALFTNAKNKEVFRCYANLGAASGALMPKTNATVLNRIQNDEFHFSGFGVSANVGLSFKFYKYFFFESHFKGGYINMFDIVTTGKKNVDRARQAFGFLQYNASIGFAISL